MDDRLGEAQFGPPHPSDPFRPGGHRSTENSRPDLFRRKPVIRSGRFSVSTTRPRSPKACRTAGASPTRINSPTRRSTRFSPRSRPAAAVRYGCFCAQKPFAHNSLQQSLDVKHFVPRARHSDAPGACEFVTPVGFDPAQATRAAATTTVEKSCIDFMATTSSTPAQATCGPSVGAGSARGPRSRQRGQGGACAVWPPKNSTCSRPPGWMS
jgi:hypothetical protein